MNPHYISLNWEASGGGAFAVIPLSHKGKLPDQIPLFRGHTSAVLDTDFNPFNDQLLASASDDGKIGLWKVPDDYKIVYEPEEEIEDVAPIAKLSGHQRKVGHVKFHPTANNVLASSSADYTVKLWDVESQKAHQSLAHKDIITSFDYNQDGSLLATTSRDKQIRIWDLRTGEVVSSGAGHTGAKNSRVVWLDADRIATTGFSKLSDRQLALWNVADVGAGPIGGFRYLDSSSGICMPFYDADTKTLFLAGKGDGNIRYYEYGNDDFFELSEYQSTDPQRGIAFMPKRALNIKGNEIVRAYKTVKDSYVEPVGFHVPRRAETFQSDIYPDCYAGVPSLTAEEFFEGKTARPFVVSVEDIYEDKPITKDNVHEAQEDKTEFKKPEPVKAAESKTDSRPESKSSEPKEEKPDLTSKGSFGTSSSAFSGDKVNSMLAKASEDEEPRKRDDDNNDDWENSSLLATRNRLAKTGKIEVVYQAASGGKTMSEKEIGAMVRSGKMSTQEGEKAVEKVREEEKKAEEEKVEAPKECGEKKVEAPKEPETKEVEAETKKPEPVEEKAAAPEPVEEKSAPKAAENGKSVEKAEAPKEITPLPLLKKESVSTTAAVSDGSDKRISSLEDLVHSLVSQVKSQQETIEKLSKKLDACADCCAESTSSKNECANRPEGAEQCDNCDC